MRFSHVLSLSFASSLIAIGCGFGVSQSNEPDAGPPPDGGSDGTCTSLPPSAPCVATCDGHDEGYTCIRGNWVCVPQSCPVPPPPPTCSGVEPNCYDCNGQLVSALCEGSTWQCPVYGCPIEPVDAGCGDAPPKPCEGPVPCPGVTWTPVCNGVTWTCEEFGECIDGGPDASPDAGPDAQPQPDANPPPQPPFACVDVGCNPETTYCQITTGGAVVDGGGFGAQCIPLPTTCSAGEATCACVQALQGIGCSCIEQHGDVTVTCEIP